MISSAIKPRHFRLKTYFAEGKWYLATPRGIYLTHEGKTARLMQDIPAMTFSSRGEAREYLKTFRDKNLLF